MKSKTSFFNWMLFRRNLLRTLPLWIIYTLVFLVVLPLSNLDLAHYGLYVNFANNYLDAALLSGHVVHLIYGTAIAAMLFSYLGKTRSAYMLHAFPVTRSSLFVTNLVSGLAVMLLPQIHVAISALALCRGAHGWIGAAAVGMTVVYMTLTYLFYFGLAVFCMHLTGKTAAGVLTALVCNFLVVILEGLTRATVEPLLYGITPGDSALTFLSPFIHFLFEWGDIPKDGKPLMEYLLLGGAGGLLLFFSWLLYRRRHMERAGDVVAFRWARPVFKYVFTWLITMVLGWLLVLILMGGDADRSEVLLLGALLGIACVIGCFVAEMLLKRTVKVFHWKQFVSCAVCLTVLWGGMAALYYDAFGLLHRVPKQENVTTVEMDFSWDSGDADLTLDTPEGIEKALDYHRAMLTPDLWSRGNGSYNVVTLTYRLTSGRTLTRTYEVDREATPDFFTDPEIVGAYLENCFAIKGPISVNTDELTRTLNAAQIEGLRAALQKDMEEELLDLYDLGRVVGTKPFAVSFKGSGKNWGRVIYIDRRLAPNTYEYLREILQ